MVVISYIKLYKKMQEEGFSALQAFRNMGRIRKMDPSILKALQEWLEGGYPVLTVNGVSFEELVEDEDMNPIRAFLMLDWIHREPASAMRYMAVERYVGKDIQLSESEKKKLDEVIGRKKVDTACGDISEWEDKSDIVLND